MALVTLSWSDWAAALSAAVAGVPDEQLLRAAKVIATADVVLTAGNGGSSALASHMAQAILKPDYAAGGGRPAVCLTDNVPTMTAHANDGGWPDALLEVARPFVEVAGPGKCVLVAISSSGRSENVVRLVRFVRYRECAVIGFTGFEGEPLRSLSTVSIHVDSKDYEVVEPAHDALLHRVQYHLRGLLSART